MRLSTPALLFLSRMPLRRMPLPICLVAMNPLRRIRLASSMSLRRLRSRLHSWTSWAIATADEAARVVEKVEEAREAKIVQESLDLFASSDAEMTGERARVQMVLQDNPDMRVQLDDQGTTITAAELLAREEEHAKQVEDMADKALPVAEICALVNNGV